MPPSGDGFHTRDIVSKMKLAHVMNDTAVPDTGSVIAQYIAEIESNEAKKAKIAGTGVDMPDGRVTPATKDLNLWYKEVVTRYKAKPSNHPDNIVFFAKSKDKKLKKERLAYFAAFNNRSLDDEARIREDFDRIQTYLRARFEIWDKFDGDFPSKPPSSRRIHNEADSLGFKRQHQVYDRAHSQVFYEVSCLYEQLRGDRKSKSDQKRHMKFVAHEIALLEEKTHFLFERRRGLTNNPTSQMGFFTGPGAWQVISLGLLAALFLSGMVWILCHIKPISQPHNDAEEGLPLEDIEMHPRPPEPSYEPPPPPRTSTEHPSASAAPVLPSPVAPANLEPRGISASSAEDGREVSTA
ncbi:MAG: hypothetical protein Q9169_005860 [Polycauliona sp. 2 TL-2023]